MADAGDAGSVDFDEATGGGGEEFFDFFWDGGGAVFYDECGATGGVSDGGSPECEEAAHVLLVEVDHLAGFFVTAPYFLAPADSFGGVVFEASELEWLAFVSAGEDVEVEPDVVEEEV